jgi:hypothetical protein
VPQKLLKQYLYCGFIWITICPVWSVVEGWDEVVGFINVFQIYANMFRQVVANHQGVVRASEATQAISVLWMYMDYDLSSVVSCTGMAMTC